MADPNRDQLLDAAFVVRHLADLVKERIYARGLTQLEAALSAGVDHSNLSRFLNGRRGLNAATAEKLITWLGESA